MLKKLGLGLILLIVVIFYFKGSNLIDLLTGDSINRVVSYVRSWGLFAPLISIILMILQAIVAPIPSFLITGANGSIFGIYLGFAISWIGAMFGAITAFYLSRVFGYEQIKKKLDDNWLYTFKKMEGSYGFWFVLIMRLLPVVSFDLISFAAGLAGMQIKRFLLATGIGMIPGTIAYTLLGHGLVDIDKYQNVMLYSLGFLIVLFLVGWAIRCGLLKQKKTKDDL
ncbi:TVP38/TMEM64 family protein [Pseudalkalibacillus sp. A8]|uniref:TVP38/TMEM64 family protein n=1 Tax=Pseudalkalibacillus sp. A8 TaxID=3382641 RepID=UPI0038B444F7